MYDHEVVPAAVSQDSETTQADPFQYLLAVLFLIVSSTFATTPGDVETPGGDVPKRDGKKHRLRNWFAGFPRAGRIVLGAIAGAAAATLVALGINYGIWAFRPSAVERSTPRPV